MAAAASLPGFVATLSSRSLAHHHRRRCPSHHHHFSPPRPLSARPGSHRLKALVLPSRTHKSASLVVVAAAVAAAASTDYSSEDEEAGTQLGSEQQEYEEEDEEQASYEMTAAVADGPPRQESGRLYVGNLPFSMTPSQLAEIFGEAGTVETVEVVYDRVTERSRGFAFVTMASFEEANEAIRMFDGSQVGGRTVKVNFPEVPRGGEREVLGPRMRSRGYVDSAYKVYAGNLGWSVTSQAVMDAFASQPGVLGAKVIFDKETGRSRGFGFVSFASAEECQAAIDAMNGVKVEGRPLRLSVAEGRPSFSSSQVSRVEEPQESALESTLSY